MKLLRMCTFSFVALFVAGPIAGQEPGAEAILKKVKETYLSLQTYKAEGTIETEIRTGTTDLKQNSSFSIVLKKPNLYLISWSQTGGPIPQSGTVWNDGTDPYLYMGTIKAYSKMASDEIALGGATGISGGIAHTIPSLFLSASGSQPDPLSRIQKTQIERTETFDGDPCYVISGPSTISKRETYWISKKSHLIRKYSRSLEVPDGAEMPEMSDAELEQAIEGLGEKVNEESKTKMRKMMAGARERIKAMNLKGTSTEIYSSVSSPELDQDDFQYTPPEGTVLKESLFGGFLK